MRRNAVLFVLISLCSGFGSTAMSLAAGLWILDLTGSAGLAALAGLGVYAPTLAAPWLGALVDRFPRRRLLIVVDLLISAAILALLAAPSAGWIYVVLLIRGVSYVLLDAGETALLPAALPASLLGDVNGWRSSAQEGMKLLAPLAGAALYAWRGPHPVIFFCATLPLITASLYALVQLLPPLPVPGEPLARSVYPGTHESVEPLARSVYPGTSESADPLAQPAHREIPEPGEPLARPARPGSRGIAEPLGRSANSGTLGRAEPLDRPVDLETPGPAEVAPTGNGVNLGWRSVRAGLVALWREPLRTPVLVAAVAIAVSGMTNAAVLLHLVDGLHRPATHLGILSSVQGAGSIVGGLLVGRLLAHLRPARVAALGAALFAVACVAWSLPWWPAMLAGSALTGLGLPWTLIAGITAIQTGTPGHLLGRVAATGNMLMFGPITLAIPLGSALAQLGARPPLLLGAAVVLAAALVAAGRDAGRPAHQEISFR
jgi:MFS family permease